MAFPLTELPVSVFIAPDASPTVDTGGWDWVEITDDVRIASGIVIEQGRGDEAARVDPGRCVMTINNRGGHYSPRNPLGQWYGRLGKNTPIQVRVDLVADAFSRTTSNGWGTSDSGYAWTVTSPSTWSTNGSAGRMALASVNTAAIASLTGVGSHNADLTYSASLSAVTTGGPWISGALLRYTDSDNYLRFHTEFKPSGAITVKLVRRVGGSSTDLAENLTTSTSYSAGSKVWTRCQADGPTLRIKVWSDGDAEPDSWDLTHTDDVYMPGTGFGYYQWRHATNTNVGTLTVSVDDLAVQAVLFTGNVPEWPVRWDKSGSDCWTPITASGILRRLQQGASPLRSPLYRRLFSQDPLAYWPLEDGGDATTASSGLTGGASTRITVPEDVSFAADSTLPGSETSAHLRSAATSIIGPVSRRLPGGTTGFSVLWLMKLDSLPTSKTTFFEIAVGTGTVSRWVVSGSATALSVDAYDVDGTLVDSEGPLIYVDDPTEWIAFQLETEDTGSTVDWVLIWQQVGGSTFWSMPGNYTGSTGSVSEVKAGGWPMYLAHIWVGENTLSFVDSGFSQTANGFIGETASARIERLSAEEGVPVGIVAGDSSSMGPQRAATFLELLRVAEAADMGVLYESGGALAYRPRGARYNRPVDLALDFEQGHVAEPPEPTDDDQRLRNDWTVSRDGGGTARYVDEDHLARHGRYDEADTINIETDDELPYQAGWRVHLGTFDEMRWPRIELNLAAKPGLIGQVAQMVVGSRMTVDNPPDAVAGEEIDVLVEGYAMTLKPYTWDVELNCSPARVWDIAVEGSARAGSGSSATVSDFDAGTDTSLQVASTGELWSTDASDYPLQIRASGVVLEVTAVTGASSPQTFTVAAAPVNGIEKTIPAGSTVELADKAVTAL